MKTMLGLEPASLLLLRFFVAMSFTEQPANKAVAETAVAFKNFLLFILPSRKKLQVIQPPDTIAGVTAEVILLYHAKLRHGKATYGCAPYMNDYQNGLRQVICFLHTCP
jgi:hypothetical protein